MPKCAYEHCRVEVANVGDYCAAHNLQAKKEQRRGGDFVPGKSTKLNKPGDAGFEKIKAWCDAAKREIEVFRVHPDCEDWLDLFFGGESETAKQVLELMPSVLDEWKSGRCDIVMRPVYEITNTPNSVVNATATLAVSPSFLKPVASSEVNKWTLIHESSHGVTKFKPEIVVIDHRYQSQGAAFHALTPKQRVLNADHYQWVVRQFKDNGVLQSEASQAFRIVDPQPTNGQETWRRTISGGRNYADYVKKSAGDLFQFAWLGTYDLMIGLPDKFHDGKKVEKWFEKPGLAILLPGKDSRTIKNKDFIRIEAIYQRTRNWIDYVDRANFTHKYKEGGRGQPGIEVSHDAGGNGKFKLKSQYQVQDPVMEVENRDLSLGVKKVVEEIVERQRPYLDVRVDTVVRLAKRRLGKNINNVEYQWIRDI